MHFANHTTAYAAPILGTTARHFLLTMLKKIFSIAIVLWALCACTKKPEEVIIPVTSISLNFNKAGLLEGESYRLQATITPSDDTDPVIKWSSSDSGVVTVDQQGVITGKKAGTATITVSCNGFTDTCEVTVSAEAVPVESVHLGLTKISVPVGKVFDITVTVSPDSATIGTVSWSSSNPDVATVNEQGQITALAPGHTTITVEVGGKSDSCSVEVFSSSEESITLDKENLDMGVGDTYTLKATVQTQEGTVAVTWSSSNTAVATVSESGVVTAKGAGEAVITAKAGNLEAQCKVTVTDSFIPVGSVTFEHDELIVYKGDSYKINVTVLPENATDKTVTWTSSDPGIATISQEGIITGIGSGWVDITAKAGEIEAVCRVFAIGEPEPPFEDPHDGEENGHYWVDLGLPSGTMWATMNLGASSSTEIGDLFAWGETEPRTESDTRTYKWQGSKWGNFTKYNFSNTYGVVDNKMTLDIADDAAHAVWGGNWRTPTLEEVRELLDEANCTTYWPAIVNNITCLKVISKSNNKYIYIPSTRHDSETDFYTGWYWTSNLDSDYPTKAATLTMFNNPGTGTASRDSRLPVRAVIGNTPYIPVKSVAFETSTLDITAGETKALSVTVLPENASHREVTWTSSNPDAATVDNKGNLTAVGTGQATITATADGVTANLYVTVRPRFESISINPSYMELEPGETASVTVTVTPVEYLDYCQYGYANRSINIMDVEPTDNKLKFNITAKAGGDGKFDFHVYVNGSPMTVTCRVTVLSDDEFDGETDGHKWVDLGLPSGIKWATCNVGANYSSQIGSKFGWGEITPSDDDSTPYKWYDSSTGKYLKYVTNAAYGEVDNLTTLLPEDDAAHVNWGGNWRMPTADEIKELEENCTYELVAKKGVVLGGKIISKINSHSIFIPMYRGEYVGYCRSSSMNQLQTDRTIVLAALYREFGRDILERNKRASVRAVIGNVPLIHVISVDFGFSHDFRTVGDVIQYSVNISPSNATYKTVTWSSSDESVATVDKNGKVTCLKAGDTLIYAEADGKSDRFVLKVSPAATFLALNPSKISMHVGETQTINISLTPRGPYQTFESGADGDISYYIETDDDNVPVRLVITATKVGTYSVYFGAGGKRATCEVTVLE